MDKQAVRKVLEAVDARFKDGRYWTQGYWAKDQWEASVEYDDYSACCWCLAGAIHKETGPDINLYTETTEYLANHLVEMGAESRLAGEDPDSVLMYWNDTKSRTFADIKEVLHECIEELSNDNP